MTQTVKKAVRVRLQAILEEKEKGYLHWVNNIKNKLNRTRQKEVQRKQEKIIQALRIVIYDLTPMLERDSDLPIFYNRKEKHNED